MAFFYFSFSSSELSDLFALPHSFLKSTFFSSHPSYHSHNLSIFLSLSLTHREGDPCALSPEGLELLDNVSELSYLTQVVIRLFEDSQQPGRLRCELSFSPGANNCPYKDNACEVRT